MGPTLNWWSIHYSVDSCEGDSCYIFDCCSAASDELSRYNDSELLVACAWEQMATHLSHFSLTRALIDQLRDLNGAPESLAGIFARIVRRTQQDQIGSSPIYIPKRNSPSIVLRPAGSPTYVTRSMREQRVLLSVKINGSINLDDWKVSLAQSIPDNVLSGEISIEGAFQGSQTLLFAVPIEIWVMLPCDNPAYTFVAYVSSGNVLSQLSLPSVALPFRPASPRRESEQELA